MVTALIAGAGLGLASSFHCATMCGPLVMASCTRDASLDRNRTLSYSVARMIGYGVMGAVVGGLGAPIAGSWQLPIRLAAAAIAAFVIARAGVRLLRPVRDPELVTLKRSAPKRRAFPPALLGLATAVFPCGALLSGLILAATTGSAALGSAAMIAFAIASAPGVLLALIGATSLARRFGHVRRLAGAVLIAVAGLTMFQAAMAARPDRSCCQHKS